MEHRKFPRMKTNIIAEVNKRQALLENVSRQGIKMKLWSDAVPETHDVEVTFTVGKQTINLKGIIRWSLRDRHSFQDLKIMGVYIEDAPEEYYRFIDTLFPWNESAVRI
jgi:hypothetical protein